VGARRRINSSRCFRIKLLKKLLQLAHALVDGRPLLGVLRTK
jgi:hypothetical protein